MRQLSNFFSYPTSFWSHARRISGVLLYLIVSSYLARRNVAQGSSRLSIICNCSHIIEVKITIHTSLIIILTALSNDIIFCNYSYVSYSRTSAGSRNRLDKLVSAWSSSIHTTGD